MEELVRWLHVQLDEDERVAKEAGRRSLEWSLARPLDDAELGDAHWLRPPELKHVERHDPARVLREIDAKRQVLRDLEQAELSLAAAAPGTPPHDLMTGAVNMLRRVARLGAVVYEDRPGFRPEWVADLR